MGDLSLFQLGRLACERGSEPKGGEGKYSFSCKYSKGINVQREKGCSSSRTASTPE